MHIQILGINEKGYESGNSGMTSGRTLPWLQDVDANGNVWSDVWYDLWHVTYQDVVILDGSNSRVGVYNLTTYSLATPANYQALRTVLVDAAMASQHPWLNADEPADVTHDQRVTPLDALAVINELNGKGPQKLPPPVAGASPAPYVDTNGDGYLSPADVLQVILGLDARWSGEGEGGATTAAPLAASSGVAATQATGWDSADAGADVLASRTPQAGTAMPVLTSASRGDSGNTPETPASAGGSVLADDLAAPLGAWEAGWFDLICDVHQPRPPLRN